MLDREKVIKGLELCLKTINEPDCRKECPYYEACQKYEGRVVFQPLMRDALALLKEQKDGEIKGAIEETRSEWPNETLPLSRNETRECPVDNSGRNKA